MFLYSIYFFFFYCENNCFLIVIEKLVHLTPARYCFVFSRASVVIIRPPAILFEVIALCCPHLKRLSGYCISCSGRVFCFQSNYERLLRFMLYPSNHSVRFVVRKLFMQIVSRVRPCRKTSRRYSVVCGKSTRTFEHEKHFVFKGNDHTRKTKWVRWQGARELLLSTLCRVPFFSRDFVDDYRIRICWLTVC